MAHRLLQWGVEVLIGEAELHQPSPLAPQDLFQHLAVLALPPGKFFRPGTASVELRGDGCEVHLALRHGSFARREALRSLKKLSSLRRQQAFTLIGGVLSYRQSLLLASRSGLVSGEETYPVNHRGSDRLEVGQGTPGHARG